MAQLKLDDHKVMQRERQRIAREGDVDAPFVIRVAYTSLCWVLDVIFENRPIQRFWCARAGRRALPG